MAEGSEQNWRKVVGAGIPEGAKRPVSRKSRAKWAGIAGAAGLALGIGADEGARRFILEKPAMEGAAEVPKSKEESLVETIVGLGADVTRLSGDMITKARKLWEEKTGEKVDEENIKLKIKKGLDDQKIRKQRGGETPSTSEGGWERVETPAEPELTEEMYYQAVRDYREGNLAKCCPILKKFAETDQSVFFEFKSKILKKDSRNKNVQDYCGEHWK